MNDQTINPAFAIDESPSGRLAGARASFRRFMAAGFPRWPVVMRRKSLRDRSGVAEAKLLAIAGYAEFIAANPEMPATHKDRFLAAIIRGGEELRAAGSKGA